MVSDFIYILYPMIFYVIAGIVPLILVVLIPKILNTDAIVNRPLYIACFLFFISWWLPSPHIDGMNTAFVTHFVGGGIFSGFLWLYLVRATNLKLDVLMQVLTLFALVSMLGVANELFEWVLFKLGFMPEGIADTSLDLLANSMGAVFFYLILKIVRFIR